MTVGQILVAHGDTSPIRDAVHVSGGDINQAARLTTGQSSYFVKWQVGAPDGFFEAEVDGLRRLREADCLRVPQVIGQRTADSALLVLEWIASKSGQGKAASAHALGEGLAALHQHTRPQFGLEVDNFIGSLPQRNTVSASWLAFYRDHRLAPQRDLATQQGRLPEERARRLERLMANLDRWIEDSASQPALLHGDLWGGNYMVGSEGQPVLIDPAVYYGEREVELAFTELFGGFAPGFYQAYNAAYPLDPGYAQRRPLYQLYPLLVHLNLFGEGYGGAVDGVLRRYVGRM